MNSNPKHKKVAVLVGVVSLAALFAGCGWLQSKADIEAKAEHPVEVRLPANPSTGYRWMLDPPMQSGRILSEKYDSDTTDGRVGAPGTQVIQVIFPREGRFNLKLAYRRLWDPITVPPVQTTNLVIKVLPAKGDRSLMERLFTKDISPESNIAQPEEEEPQTTGRKVELRRPR